MLGKRQAAPQNSFDTISAATETSTKFQKSEKLPLVEMIDNMSLSTHFHVNEANCDPLPQSYSEQPSENSSEKREVRDIGSPDFNLHKPNFHPGP